MEHRAYDTDLTDEQFALLEPFLPRPKKMGRPPADFRPVLNAVLYLVRTGCQWRMLPRGLPALESASWSLDSVLCVLVSAPRRTCFTASVLAACSLLRKLLDTCQGSDAA